MAEIDLRDQNNNNVRDMLPHKPMRLSMENKNLLSKKGDIYVGTGKFQTVIIEDDTYKIAETAKVSVPSELGLNESAILIYDTANNLQYKKSSKSGFVTYGVQQELSDEQKRTARNNIGAPAVSDLTFLSYTVNQTETIKDPSGQGTGPKTRLLNNIFDNLTDAQKNYVRSQIGAGSAQGIAGITAGDGIKVDSSTTPSSPKVSLDVNSISQSGNKYWVQIDNKNHPYVDVSVPSSDNQTIAYAPTTTSSVSDWIVFGNNATVKLVPGNNIDMTVNTNNNYIKIDAKTYTGSDGISVSNRAISVNLADNSGLVCDSSSSGQLKLNVNSKSQSGDMYWVQIDGNNHPYVNVSIPAENNQTIAYAPTTTSSFSENTYFGSDDTVKLVPGDNITMDVSSTDKYIKINAATYTGGKGISVSNGAISVNLATNSGLVFDSSSPGLLRLNARSDSQYADGDTHWVRVDTNNHPYVSVSSYTGSNGISISGKTISLKKGYDVPIEYQPSASSTAGFASNKLYLIGTWTGA